MKLDLDRQESGRSLLPVQGTIALDWAEDRPAEISIAGDLQVDNLENRVLLSGGLTAHGQATCGRCLEEFDFHWPVAVECMVLRDAHSEEGLDDSMVLHQRAGELDLQGVVRESAILAYPQVNVCRDDCRGLCSQCGLNLNAEECDCTGEDQDPRWEGLP